MASAHQLPQRDIRDGRRPLIRIPLWYKDGASFQYNWRCGLGFLPGALLIGIVCGKTFVATALFLVLVHLLLYTLGYELIQMFLIIPSVFVCQFVNIYCMSPLIWHSILNLPLFMIFHGYIAICGLWAVIQLEEFIKQDPRVTLLAEKGLFIVLPGLNIVMVTWMSGLLMGQQSLPIVIAITGICVASIFTVPLQSSFVKEGTPSDQGLILPRAVGIIYLVLVIALPGVIYTALNSSFIYPTTNVTNYLQSYLYYVTPMFILSLLEAQGLFNWLGNIKYIYLLRWISGTMMMIFLTFYVYFQRSSTELTTLSVLLLFCFFALVSSLSTTSDQYQQQSYSVLTLLLTLAMGLLYVAASFQLSWTISYTFSVFSLPLSMFQLILLLLTFLSLLILLVWHKDLTLLWPTYHALFVGCEYVLSSEGYYDLSLLLATGLAAVILCLRLHVVGRLPLPLTILCVSLHVAKLSQFLPLSSINSSSSSLLSLTGSIFMMLAFIKLSLTETMSLRVVMSLCMVVITGLILSVELLVVPVITSITHSPPTSPDIAAVICLISSLIVHRFLHRVKESVAQRACTYIPPSLVFIAGLLWLLQPEFNLFEVSDAVGVVFLHQVRINSYIGRILTTEQMSLIAWTIIIKWVVILYAIILAVTISMKVFLPQVTIYAAGSLLFSFMSLLVSLIFAHHLPFSLLGLLYILTGLITGYMVTIVMFKNTKTAWLERLVLSCIILLCIVTLSIEWYSLPSHVTESVPLPSGNLYLIIFALIAAVIKIKSLLEGQSPLLPITNNISCLMAYILGITVQLPLHLDKAVIVSLSSCIMLLAQEDKLIIPRRNNKGISLAPSLVLSSTTLFVISFWKLCHILFSNGPSILTILELLCLLAIIPGQIKFLYCLWWGMPLRYTLISIIIYMLPNGFLTQFGGSINTVLGSTAVLCFILLALSDIQTITVL